MERTPKSVDVSTSDVAQKKFGSAKAISSDQFFNDNANDYETKANLSRFQGSSSISSSEFFGNNRGNYFYLSNPKILELYVILLICCVCYDIIFERRGVTFFESCQNTPLRLFRQSILDLLYEEDYPNT